MRRNHRPGDRAGIVFLLALIGSVFIPSVLSEARQLLPPASRACLRAAASRPAAVARLAEKESSASREVGDIELPSETGSGPADAVLPRAPGSRLAEQLPPPASLLPRSAGPPRHHKPRAPPPPRESRGA